MIKVTTNEKGKEKAIGFPKLMVCRDGEVVFVISVDGIDATGFSLFDPTGVRASGFYSNCWNVLMLSDYTGEITLKNEII
jgi:hypothetical protein